MLSAGAVAADEEAPLQAARNTTTGIASVSCLSLKAHNAFTGTTKMLLAAVVLKDEPIELALCDCEFATGPPNGLSCDKEGWFISSFEREGSWVRKKQTPSQYMVAI